MTKEQLENYFISINEKKYRATQIYEFLYQKKIDSINDITNISSNIKERIQQDFSFYKLQIVKKQEDIGVKKYLFKLILHISNTNITLITI